MQLRCKRKGCEVCGPENQALMQEDILRHFNGQTMHCVEVEDGGKEYDALRKRIDRGGGLLLRLPAPAGKAMILTNLDVGEAVQDPVQLVREAVDAQPCDGRHASSSREWKGAGTRESSGRWTRQGITRLPTEKRVQIYQEEGCEPQGVPGCWLPPDAVGAHDLRLPLPKTAEMERLAERLELDTDEPPEWVRRMLEKGRGSRRDA